jgi:hypothetical protein
MVLIIQRGAELLPGPIIFVCTGAVAYKGYILTALQSPCAIVLNVLSQHIH